MDEKEVVAWLKKKDPYTWFKLQNLAKKDVYPVIIDNDEYYFFINCVRLLDKFDDIMEEFNETLKKGYIKTTLSKG